MTLFLLDILLTSPPCDDIMQQTALAHAADQEEHGETQGGNLSGQKIRWLQGSVFYVPFVLCSMVRVLKERELSESWEIVERELRNS